MKIQCNNFFIKKKNYNMRTIRPSSNHVYFVYYYTDVCDSTLIGIFFSKHRSTCLSSIQLKLCEKVYKSNYAIDHIQ